jgi:hypothetical protein
MTDEEQEDGPTSGESTGDQDLDRQVAKLEDERDRVADQIDDTRSDWESKKGDQSVPGAVPAPGEEEASGDPEGDADPEVHDADHEVDDADHEVDGSGADGDDASDEESEG